MKLLLVCLAAVLYALGWAVGLVAVVVLWCWDAVAVGWNEALQLRRRSAVRSR